jgi:hypothetical protein
MKIILRIFLLVQILFVLNFYETNAQVFNWAKSIGSSFGSAVGKGISVDNNGKCYITGLFSGTVIFDTIPLTTYGSGDNIFIAKYDHNGNCLWAKKAGGTYEDGGNSIFIDMEGNSYITGAIGVFGGTATFDTIKLTGTGAWDIFIAKYDSNGKCIWAKLAGGSNINWGNSIAVDKHGNSFVTGYFNGSTYFDSIKLTGYALSDIFLAKYNEQGSCIWVKQAGGSSDYESGYSVSTDTSGNSYLTGSFQGSAIFDSIHLTSFGKMDIFVAKYDSNGNCLWAKQLGGNDNDLGYGISTDVWGNCYVTGYFTGTASFGTVQLTATGSNDIFVAKFDANGNCIWAKSAGGTNNNYGFGISVDIMGNSYVTGLFNGNATFGAIQLQSYNMSTDIFITKYDPNGNCLWAKHAGGDDLDCGYGITLDKQGNCYATGSFKSAATFGAFQLSGGIGDEAFITKIPNVPSSINIKNNSIFKYSLLQNYPNPFNPSTVISYSLPSATNIKLVVYNILGQSINILENGFKNAGNYSLNFNASNLPSGIYFYRLEAGQFTQVKKMMIMK